MTLNAPPHAHQTTDSVEQVPVEVLIPEARQRARRRRRWYWVAAAVVAITATAAGLYGAGPWHHQPSTLDRAGARIAAASGRSATLVAVWGEMHTGWVLVYGDGRVIVDGDGRVVVDGDLWIPVHSERYLTAAGLEGVRSGTVDPSWLLLSPDTLPEGMWADPEFSEYMPSEYAVGLRKWQADGDLVDIDPMVALRGLPTPVQELLRGKQRTCTLRDPVFSDPPTEPELCFTLAPDQVRALRRNADPYDVDRVTREELRHLWLAYDAVAYRAADGDLIELVINPLMPHGQLVQIRFG